MTTRPDLQALHLLRHHRVQHCCHMVKVTPRSIAPLYLTDHDRAIDFDGATYTPVSFGQMSAERREAAFRSGNQEIRGSIDGTTITIPDLDAHRYRGAEVLQVLVNWKMPWIVYARHRKWIRNIVRDGSTFIGTLEGRTQALERPTGGRFGGTFSQTCTYELGDSLTCKKDISADVRTVTVETVVDDRRTCQFTVASWTGTFLDDYYRGGSIEWTTGDNAGNVSAIHGYVHATRQTDFLFPTLKPIQAGDIGIAKPGCDGLLSTCRDKYANQLNFGGDPFAPSSTSLIQPVGL